MPQNFALYLGWDLINVFQSVVTYDEDGADIVVITTQKGETYRVPAEGIRKIEIPDYTIGDSVSPANHPEFVGTICANCRLLKRRMKPNAPQQRNCPLYRNIEGNPRS